MGGVAALAGLGAYALISAGNYLVTKMIDPSTVTLNRNRYILSALGLGGGLLLAQKHPMVGAAVAAGSVVAGIGSKLTIWLGTQINQFVDPGGTAVAARLGRVGAVYGQMGGYEAQMSGYQAMQGVYGNVGGVYGNVGAVAPAPPWTGNPFAN